MQNPFKAIKEDLVDSFHSARHTDCVDPNLATIGAVIISPFTIIGAVATALAGVRSTKPAE